MRTACAGAVLIALMAISGPAWAEEEPLLPTVEVTASRAAPCVASEVDGKRVTDFACLSQRMAADAAKGTAPPQGLGSEAITRRPPSALGLAHREATRQRMGNTFGISTRPQRPPPPPPPPPFGRPR